jgi:hypothetical protein
MIQATGLNPFLRKDFKVDLNLNFDKRIQAQA